MKIIRNLVFMLISMVFMLAISFANNAMAGDNHAQQPDTLSFLGNKDLAPILFEEDGIPKGVVVDIVAALSERIECPIEIDLMDWSEAQELMQQGKADALIQMNQTAEREKVYDFSDDLLESRFSIFTLTENSYLTDANDLKGFEVGVEPNGFPKLFLQKEPLIQLVDITSIVDGFHYMKSNKIDAIVVDEWVGAYIIASNHFNGISIVGEPITQSYSSIAVEEGNIELLSKINYGLKEMKEDGTYQRILEKWRPKEVVILTKEQIRVNIFTIWIGVLSCIILVSCISTIILVKQLAKIKKMKQELEEEHHRLSDIIVATNAGTWEWNIVTGEVVINERWAQISGYTKSEIKHFKIHDMNDLVYPEDLMAVEKVLKHIFDHQLNYYKMELRVRNKDGSWNWVIDHGRIVKWDSDGKPLFMSGTRHDISERKNAEHELIQAIRRAEAANATKTQFLANMSHEIRTPMNGIMGVIQLLEMSNLTKQQTEYLNICKASSNSLLKMINDILEFSKIEDGVIHIEKKEFNIRAFMKEIECLHGPSIRSKELNFRVSIDEDVPSFLYGDFLKLRQILSNIIGNAVKFTHKGYINLMVRKVEESNNFIKLEWSVKDSGIGISKNNIDTIYKSFNQGDNSITKKYGGIGLGLSISKGLVELMQGELWAESNEGDGSSFYFTCLLEKAEGFHADLLARSAKANSRKVVALNILIVEDDEISRIIVTRFAKYKGWEVSLAVNGQEAINEIKNKSFDVILMDIQMPVLDGYLTTKEIRKIELNKGIHTPIIAMTAHIIKDEIENSFASGMDDYITKPLDYQELYDVVDKWTVNKINGVEYGRPKD